MVPEAVSSKPRRDGSSALQGSFSATKDVLIVCLYLATNFTGVYADSLSSG